MTKEKQAAEKKIRNIEIDGDTHREKKRKELSMKGHETRNVGENGEKGGKQNEGTKKERVTREKERGKERRKR